MATFLSANELLLLIFAVNLQFLFTMGGQVVSLNFEIFDPSHCVNENNPIIFLHGLGGAIEHWVDIPQTVADATQRRTFVIDARNHGESPWTDEFHFDLNVQDIMHFIENIEAEKVTLVGHSMGGITAMKTALKMPFKVDKIIIEDIGVSIPEEIVSVMIFLLSNYEEAVSNIPEGSTKEEAEKFISKYEFDHLPDALKATYVSPSGDEYQEHLRVNADGSVTSRSNIKAIMKALRSGSIISEYEGLFEGPARFIFGEKSRFPVFEDAENIKKFFPNSKFTGIPNASHDVHSDAKQLYTEVLLKFLKE